jgi:hypothetical protein
MELFNLHPSSQHIDQVMDESNMTVSYKKD